MKKKVFITGGSGLLALNWALTVNHRFDVVLGLHNNKKNIGEVEYCYCDIESADAFSRVLALYSPDIVIHTAGLANVEACEENPFLARHVNVDLAVNVAIACFRVGVKLVYISTDHLFSGYEAFVGEDEKIYPRNVYGNTKGEAELRVLDIDSNALVIRTNFYGWGPIYRKSFSDQIIGALRQEVYVTLFDDVFYTPILVDEVAIFTHKLIDLKASGIFHLVGDDRVSKYEFGQKIAKIFSLDASKILRGSINDREELVARPRDMSLSNDKVCNLLGQTLGGVEAHLIKLREQEISRTVILLGGA